MAYVLPFSTLALRKHVQHILNVTPSVEPQHRFALIVDVKTGAKIALATRARRGWRLDVEPGYNWKGSGKGWQARVSLSRSW